MIVLLDEYVYLCLELRNIVRIFKDIQVFFCPSPAYITKCIRLFMLNSFAGTHTYTHSFSLHIPSIRISLLRSCFHVHSVVLLCICPFCAASQMYVYLFIRRLIICNILDDACDRLCPLHYSCWFVNVCAHLPHVRHTNNQVNTHLLTQ